MSTDGSLLAGLWAGQEGAFEALFTRHYRTVYGILYRLVGDEAEDLAQEVFLKLYVHPPAKAGRAEYEDLRAWLCRVAIHLGYNALRARRRWQVHRDALARDRYIEAWQGAEPDPGACAERIDERSKVRELLARLGKREASILVLRHSGFTYREIADVLGVAPTSVGTLLSRAERALERAYRNVSTMQSTDSQEGKDAMPE